MFLQPCGRCRDCTRAPISFSPDQTAPTFFYVEPCDPTPRTWLMLKKVRLSSDIRSTFLFFTILYLYCTHMIIIYTSCHRMIPWIVEPAHAHPMKSELVWTHMLNPVWSSHTFSISQQESTTLNELLKPFDQDFIQARLISFFSPLSSLSPAAAPRFLGCKR